MDTMILTPTVKLNFDKLKVSVDSSVAVLIQGDIGCGKSFLVNALANYYGTKETMIQVNVDDSFDSKDLLGKFSATDTPGVFEWIPGPLTSAVKNGFWILLEDIDLASFDVFSVLLSLFEESTLFLPEKNMRIQAHPNFKIIATQQLRLAGGMFTTRKSNSIPFLELWGTVFVESLPFDEICTIATALYSVPLNTVQKLAMLFDSPTMAPFLTLRCLLKWCRRVDKRLKTKDFVNGFISSTVRELMFCEAFDCILARCPEGNSLASAIALLADSMDIAPNVAESLVRGNKPEMILTKEYMTVGRATLPLFSNFILERDTRIAFAPTKHAMSLLERIAVGVQAGENVLLTGETGVGKTFIVQYLADSIGQKLIVHNLNQQTDTSDFMGGWKPLDISTAVRKAYNLFLELFSQTFNASKNIQFLEALQAATIKGSWATVIKQILKGFESFKLKNNKQKFSEQLNDEWCSLGKTAMELANTLEKAKTTFVFHFEEGSLAKAWREGHWILLDELNLATTEVLERVSSVLGDVDVLFLTDKGNCEPIRRHQNFHVFANMNPPTDVGKKDLPPSLRSKFTEIYVTEPFDRYDINIIVNEYIGHLAADCKTEEITTFFLECLGKSKSVLCSLDGETRPPSFSLRTLTRALYYVRKATYLYGFLLALFDGLVLGFATSLQRQFHAVVEDMIVKIVFMGKRPPNPTLPVCPLEGHHIAYEHIWLPKGTECPMNDDTFIITASVKGHLLNIARAIFADRPVLLEGPTSSGKSSMVKYLAQLTGHKFVRINNHESTEIQEYVGHYVSDERGKLRFVDGILVTAVRNGYWVVLDELNLAPTDVLEALNRLLDDNRELFVADTHETIKAHPNLRIFATQNPAGVYGGRKLLSRALRNRFLEITVDDIPTTELCTILCQRYLLSESFAKKMVEIMVSLQVRRQASHIFAGRHGFITPRDLFRWAERKPGTYQELAEHGFLLLAERCRNNEERQIVKDVIESVIKTELNEKLIYSPLHWPYVAAYYNLLEGDDLEDKFGIVWTESMLRLFTVVGICICHKEPVLLVGETGSSKTTVCQLWAFLLGRRLSVVNCHQHSEAMDFLGGLRPALPNQRASNVLFEWRNGPLVDCMLQGNIFLLDEISLAEDSVLERLNSVLEPTRVITLAEKSTADVIVAHEDFRILATMNPGGDFGKKELSPALRNRFTEIYVSPTTNEEEVALILSRRLNSRFAPWAKKMASLLCDTAKATRHDKASQHVSIRDVVTWVSFMNATDGHCDDSVAFMHGLDAVILDGIGVGTGQMEYGARELRGVYLEKAKQLCGIDEECLKRPFWEVFDTLEEPTLPPAMKKVFFFGAPSTRKNLSKLLRASIMRKAILLEGSPGVGKTSIVEALGYAFGKHVVRINLSEQTDIMDLLGTYLPSPSSGESVEPQFSWSDGVLLQALKAGWWVIFDELNLANQAVLEGLNALLDHRSAVFIPELNEEFCAAEEFRVFACQNPLIEGGGRKGLPRSFLNRFTKVKIEPFDVEDLMCIAVAVCPGISEDLLKKMVHFVDNLHHDVMVNRSYGSRGSPWEFNLRDVLRWAKLMEAYNAVTQPCEFIETLFIQRMRTDVDRGKCCDLARRYFGEAVVTALQASSEGNFIIKDNSVFLGSFFLAHRLKEPITPNNIAPLLLLPSRASIIRSILTCYEQNQFCLLVGPCGAGKSFCLKTAASLVGARLEVFSMNASCDTVDLLGGVDQVEGKQGLFEWRDSLILEAMISGYWLVLDNVNYCNASVLDRLNPLVEPNGKLSVNEQGLVDGCLRVVEPHPNFRLFATLDPKYGEISRAMRNRAVEIYVDPISSPSLESVTIAGSVSHCKNANVLDKLGQFHREFVLSGFHADFARPLSPQLSDALAAGAPNTFTLVKTAAMLSADANLEELKDFILYKYIQNRCGQWVANKTVIEEALERLMSKESQESNNCHPAVVDLLSAMTLYDSSSVEEVESALVRICVCRSGLALKTFLSAGDSALVKHSAKDLALFFVLEQCTDTVSGEMLTVVRKQFFSSNLMNLLSEDKISEALLLLSPDYNNSSSKVFDELWCRSLLIFGPQAIWSRGFGNIHTLISDSPMLNTAFQSLLIGLFDVTRSVVSPHLQQLISRYLNFLVNVLTCSSSPFQVNADNFILLVTNLALLNSVLKRQTMFAAGSLLSAIEEFLALLCRYLDLPYQLVLQKSILHKSVIRPKITTVDERRAFSAWKLFGNAAEQARHEKLRTALWRTAVFREEFALLLRVHLVRKGSFVTLLKSLQNSIQRFIRLYHTDLHVLSELEITLWKEVLGLPIEEGYCEELLATLMPLLAYHFILRHKLDGGRHILYGAWAGAAYEALGYAAGVSVMSIGTECNTHSEIMSDLLQFCRSLPVMDTCPFEQWELSCMEDLLSLLSLYAPKHFPTLKEANVPAKRSHGPLLHILGVVRQGMSELCEDSALDAARPLLQMLFNDHDNLQRVNSLRRIALVGVLRCRLLVPSSPIDPMYKLSFKKKVAIKEIERFNRLEEAFRWSEELSMRGCSQQRRLVHELLTTEKTFFEKASKKIVDRPDESGAKYANLVGMLHQICDTTLSDDRLALVLSEGESEVQNTREMWSELLHQQFIEILENFGGYEDVTLPMAEPAFFSAFAAKVSCLLQSQSQSVNTLFSTPETIRMMHFPSLCVSSATLPFSGLRGLQHRLAYLDSCLMFVQSVPARVLRRDFVGQLFDQYRDLYRVVEELEEKERHEGEMAVLYKERAITIEGDDEKHLRTLKELFPSYEKEFLLQDNENEGTDCPEMDNVGEVSDKTLSSLSLPLMTRAGRHTRIILSGQQGARYVGRLIDTHYQFFERLLALHDSSTFDGDKALSAFKSRFDVLASELHSCRFNVIPQGNIMLPAADENLLVGGFAARTMLLNTELLFTETSLEEKRSSGFNIFVDPAPSELRLFSVLLRNLMEAVDHLRELYPDTPSLQRCSRIAKKIAALPALTTPLMKIMNGCEVLLKECYEWERNASRSTSIMDHMTKLSSFVLRWRRLELHCWPQVFLAKRKEWELKAGMVWFRFFDLIDGGSPISDEQISERCLQFFSFCMEFMWGAHYGDFHVRLRLLNAFGLHLLALSLPSSSLLQLPSSMTSFSPFANVAMHLVDFFSQFSSLVSEKLLLALTPLEEDMETFARIMRWEDSTYYAVRATAEKSHLKMGRALAELDEILRTPVLETVLSEEQRCEEDQAMGFVSSSSVQVKSKAKNRKATGSGSANDGSKNNVVASKRNRLGKHIRSEKQFSQVKSTLAEDSCLVRGVKFLCNTSEEIIERVKELQASGVPQNQKVRALKTLFSVLEESGVPHTHVNQVPPWEELFAFKNALLTCRAVHGHLALSEELEAAAAEHYRCARWVQRMRDAERYPHKDLSGAQAKRGTGTAESLFAFAVEETELVVVMFVLRQQVSVLRDSVASCEKCAVVGGDEMLHASLEVCVQLQCFLHQTKWLLKERVFELNSVNDVLEDLYSCTDELWKLCLLSEAQRRIGVAVPDAILDQHATLHTRLHTICARLCSTGIGCVDASASLLCAALESIPTRVWKKDTKTLTTKRARTENNVSWLQEVQNFLDELESSYMNVDAVDEVQCSSVLHDEVSAGSNGGNETGNTGNNGENFAVYKDYVTAVQKLKQNSERIASSFYNLLHNQTNERRISSLLRHELLARLDASLERISSLLHFTIAALKAQSHLGLVLSRLFSILLKKGFCKLDNEEEDGSNDGDGAGGEQQDGTGMDDGHGEKDVTDQIENEDQLMNMKDKENKKDDEDMRKKEEGKDEGSDEDNAADVTTDFKADKEQRKEEEDDSDEDEESDNDSEEEMGSVDDEHAQERKRMKKDKNDRNMDSDEGGSAQDVPEDTFGNQESCDEEDDNNIETGNFENREEALREAESKLADGEHELAADADKIEDTESDSNSNNDDYDDRSSAGNTGEDPEEDDHQEQSDDGDDSSRSGSKLDETKHPQGLEDDVADKDSNNTDGANENGSENNEEGNHDNENSTASSCVSNSDYADENIFHGGQQDEHTGGEATENKKETDDNERQKKDKIDSFAGAEQEQQPDEEQQLDNAGRNWKPQRKDDPSFRRDNRETNSASRNPYKAIKDALQRHERQVQQLNLDKNVDVKKQKLLEEKGEMLDDSKIEEFEFDEEGEHEGMAATDEKPLPVVEAEEDLPDMNKDDSDEAHSEGEASEDTSRRRRGKSAMDTMTKEGSDDDDDNEDDDNARKRRNKRCRVKTTSKLSCEDDEDNKEDECNGEDAENQLDIIDMNEKINRGRRLWQEQTAAVQGLSHHLCEQLRLILAPTLADKLQGDYKTGKRLNIKRIIPFIASQFKKDRIWLRRTKPNKRNYQIVVALDDSLSMQCNSAGVMSCRAVALLAEALRQLEVGELGIASFGRETQILHHLHEPFTGESGPRLFSEVTFAQKSTNLRLLLETTLDYLDQARERIWGQTRSTTQQLQQMMFIVSDGQITEDRSELRKLLLRAEENHQIVVFVLLDVKASTATAGEKPAGLPGAEEESSLTSASVAPPTLNAKELAALTPAERMRRLKAERDARLRRVQSSSVMDMQLVEFKGGKVVRRSYMEEFPFPYYLVVRELEMLPGAIADALRQWFELFNLQH